MVAALVGVYCGFLVGISGPLYLSLIVGWDAAALLFIVWTWIIIGSMDGKKTAEHALSEDPSRPVADIILLGVSIASLGAVGLVLSNAGSTGNERLVSAAIAILSVVLSWIVVHTIYTLRYALIYYGNPKGGIDFGDETQPAYSDFAYLAFTIGMTFQVSDTAFKTSNMRRTALRHSLFSYVFGTIIVATTINLIAGLGK